MESRSVSQGRNFARSLREWTRSGTYPATADPAPSRDRSPAQSLRTTGHECAQATPDPEPRRGEPAAQFETDLQKAYRNRPAPSRPHENLVPASAEKTSFGRSSA